jgi:hypothetical protein
MSKVPRQLGRKFLEQRQNLATPRLATDHHMAGSINAVHLKH